MSELVTSTLATANTTTTTTPPVNVRVGVACLITSKAHPHCVLLGKRKGSHGAGKLATPGGHLEMNESWEECALREVKEETNLELENVQYVHVTNDPMIGNNPNKHYITIFMIGQMIENNSTSILQNMEPHKCESWDWIPFTELLQYKQSQPEILFEPMIHFLEAIEQQKISIHI